MLSTDVDDGNDDDDEFPIKRNNKVIWSRFMRDIHSFVHTNNSEIIIKVIKSFAYTYL